MFCIERATVYDKLTRLFIKTFFMVLITALMIMCKASKISKYFFPLYLFLKWTEHYSQADHMVDGV